MRRGGDPVLATTADRGEDGLRSGLRLGEEGGVRILVQGRTVEAWGAGEQHLGDHEVLRDLGLEGR
ncbi:hypothetical protein MTP03_08510 [Tsukamurella sp. PLM1]|nr:hypothetical protein MTP03_08510 [Tsukamurella sp. PLM1]